MKTHDIPFQAYKLVTVNLVEKEQKKPEFLAMQPFGVIPVYEDDGVKIFGEVL